MLRLTSSSAEVPFPRESNSSVLSRFTFATDNFSATITLRELTSPLANPQLYVEYFDPFNCECRAYGRLNDAKREDLAVKAHGYLLLTPQQEADLERRVTGNPHPVSDANAGELTGHNFWNRYEQHRGLPVRAIVKELVSNNYPTSAQARCIGQIYRIFTRWASWLGTPTAATISAESSSTSAAR
ncbi:hypothetical protein VTI28DRAFT_5191 [Corynascus sepedonium]